MSGIYLSVYRDLVVRCVHMYMLHVHAHAHVVVRFVVVIYVAPWLIGFLTCAERERLCVFLPEIYLSIYLYRKCFSLLLFYYSNSRHRSASSLFAGSWF